MHTSEEEVAELERAAELRAKVSKVPSYLFGPIETLVAMYPQLEAADWPVWMDA